MYSVLIIEDEIGIQITLEDRLVSEGYKVTIRGDGPSGEEEAKTGNYDIILLDIMLPGRDGYKVCENVRAADINTPIIMLTARNTDLDTVIGLRQGADDYIAKPFEMSVLLARIEAIIRRCSRVSSNSNSRGQTTFGEFTLNKESGELSKNETPIPLNAQEFRVLEYLIENSNKIISRDVLLDDVWGYENETTSRTVDVHIAKLRHKLDESDIPRHILTVRGRGYKFVL
ncbi:MAG: response regulator transcription factor [Spirochaetaceae bacterium]